ncbi:MAG: threonine synthase [Spirochaetota bacterium]
MENFIGYRCSLCGAEYEPLKVIYNCPRDKGNLDVVLDIEKILKEQRRFSSEASLWRYLPLLPVADPGGQGTPLRFAGWTPLYRPSRLTEQTSLLHLWIKDESSNPTASFKDRASALVVARAREIGAEVIVTASTGNAGAALAGMAAALGRQAVIMAPRNAPAAKVAQLLIFGALVFLIDGNYDQASELALEAAAEFGWYCRNTGYNPFTAEGKKTAALEIWEAVERGELIHSLSTPLSIFIPVGDGNIISGLHKGFKDLQAVGKLETIPRLFGIQAEGSAAIARAFEAETETVTPVEAETLADSISVNRPADGVRALRAARQTGGAYLTVSDRQILSALAELGKTGIFAEPAAAAAYAGMIKARHEERIGLEDPVLVLITGSGLKDVNAAVQAVEPAPVIEPSLSALKKHLSGRSLKHLT